MKKLIAVIFATFFLFSGLGFNQVHYCCQQCRAAGITHVMQESCDCIHQHNRQHHHTTACHHHNSCSIQRLSVDQPTIAQTLSCPQPTAITLAGIELVINIKEVSTLSASDNSTAFIDTSPIYQHPNSALTPLRHFRRWII